MLLLHKICRSDPLFNKPVFYRHGKRDVLHDSKKHECKTRKTRFLPSNWSGRSCGGGVCVWGGGGGDGAVWRRTAELLSDFGSLKLFEQSFFIGFSGGSEGTPCCCFSLGLLLYCFWSFPELMSFWGHHSFQLHLLVLRHRILSVGIELTVLHCC